MIDYKTAAESLRALLDRSRQVEMELAEATEAVAAIESTCARLAKERDEAQAELATIRTTLICETAQDANTEESTLDLVTLLALDCNVEWEQKEALEKERIEALALIPWRYRTASLCESINAIAGALGEDPNAAGDVPAVMTDAELDQGDWSHSSLVAECTRRIRSGLTRGTAADAARSKFSNRYDGDHRSNWGAMVSAAFATLGLDASDVPKAPVDRCPKCKEIERSPECDCHIADMPDEIPKTSEPADSLYECANCSARTGSPRLCEDCLMRRADAGSRWMGPRPAKQTSELTGSAETARASSGQAASSEGRPECTDSPTPAASSPRADAPKSPGPQGWHVEVDPRSLAILEIRERIEALECTSAELTAAVEKAGTR